MLTAVDAVVMVIDAGKGIESADAQALRSLPPARRADLHLHEQARPARRATRSSCSTSWRRVLGIDACRGELAARRRRRISRASSTGGRSEVHLFERDARRRVPRAGGGRRARRPGVVKDAWRPRRTAARRATSSRCSTARARRSTRDAVLAGELTPVFFGSAMNNFGVQLLLDALPRDSSPPPRAACQRGEHGDRAGRRRRSPASSSRSRRTWIRGTATASRSCASVSGKFERDMTVTARAHRQARAALQLAQALRAGARDRRRGLRRRRHRPRRQSRVRASATR